MSKTMKIIVILINVMMIIFNIVSVTHDPSRITPVIMCTLSLALIANIGD